MIVLVFLEVCVSDVVCGVAVAVDWRCSGWLTREDQRGRMDGAHIYFGSTLIWVDK